MHPPVGLPYLYHLSGGLILLAAFLGGAFILLRYYLRQTRKPGFISPDQTSDTAKVMFPLRLQAYERLVLFLERIHPSNLVMRFNAPELSAVRLQALLLKTIREEFEYNLSQQLYVSAQTWELVKNAKEEMVLLINCAAANIDEEAASAELVKAIFGLVVEKGRLPAENAMELIRKEVNSLG